MTLSESSGGGLITTFNKTGKIVVNLGATDNCNGLVATQSAKGKALVELGSSTGDQGTVTTYQPNGKMVVRLGATVDAHGTVTTYQTNGKLLVELGASDNGGVVDVLNKTGESIANIYADDYGNGVVWAGNRKGIGRSLQVGP